MQVGRVTKLTCEMPEAWRNHPLGGSRNLTPVRCEDVHVELAFRYAMQETLCDHAPIAPD